VGRFYLTTAIFYPNAVPHLGTAYEVIGADAIARWRRLRGDDVFFLSGNDEHALKVAQVAAERGEEPLAYCDAMARSFDAAWRGFAVSYDEYIRTSQPRHRATVEWFLGRIREGDARRAARGAPPILYKGTYEGLYCVGCEAFLREKDLVAGLCPLHADRQPQRLREDNWFFRLSAFEGRLGEWFRDNPGWLRPESKRNEMAGLLAEGLQDLSVSRPQKAIRWGIPFPGDADHVVYVWFEALINYVTAAHFREDGSLREPDLWPADLHVIGKDIVRFHSIIWPAMLWAADLPLPRAISTHGFVQVGGAKMSKSVGGAVSPVDVAREYGADALRYFLLREVPWGGDGEFSIERLEERYASDLANTLGNLLHRSLTMIEKYCDGEVPEAGPAGGAVEAHRARLRDRALAAAERYDALDFSGALDAVMDIARGANALVDETAPWKRWKEPGGRPDVEALLWTLAESLKVMAVLLRPAMPAKAAALAGQLGLDAEAFEDVRIGLPAEGHRDAAALEELRPDHALAGLDALPVAGLRVRKGDPLFPRRDRRGTFPTLRT